MIMTSQTQVLMPKATAKWLIMYTSLTFEQIAVFCNMHQLEIKAIADDEIYRELRPLDPILSYQISMEEIKLCEKDAKRKLSHLKQSEEFLRVQNTGSRYITISNRRSRYDGILWLVQNTELKNTDIRKLIGTTNKTIDAIRSKTYWNYSELKPRDPVTTGICTQERFNEVMSKSGR